MTFATPRELLDNWSDYNISYHDRSFLGLAVIVFDPKNDDRNILVGSSWETIIDQKTWTEFVQVYTTHDGHFKPTGGTMPSTQSQEATGVLEIWGSDDQHYGFYIRQKRWDFLYARIVDENTLQLSWRPPRGGSPAK